MDTFMDSAWYFFRYLDPHNNREPFSKESTRLLPVDVYVGGKDHGALNTAQPVVVLLPCLGSFRLSFEAWTMDTMIGDFIVFAHFRETLERSLFFQLCNSLLGRVESMRIAVLWSGTFYKLSITFVN
jgi:hypothetical protein